MLVTSKSKNALKLMLDLSLYQGEGFVKLKEIAKRQEISEKYLEHIVAELHRSKKVRSARGANGGYSLVKSPKEYTVGEIIKCIEGDIHTTDCTSNDGVYCMKKEKCFCLPLWEMIDKAMDEVLESISLQDLIDWKQKEKTMEEKKGDRI